VTRLAYVKIGAINRYLGVSTDTKPASDKPGSTFLELDTKNLYVYDGDSWELGNPTFQTGDVINVGDLEGKDTEGAAVTGRPVTIGYKSATGKATGVTPVNALPVQVSGSKMELYGASLNDRPDATTVPIGTTFTIVDDTHDFKTWMSNGVDWGEEI
jgi:hypothetical protein